MGTVIKAACNSRFVGHTDLPSELTANHPGLLTGQLPFDKSEPPASHSGDHLNHGHGLVFHDNMVQTTTRLYRHHGGL